MVKLDVHRYEKRIDAAIRRIKESNIPDCNKKYLMKFYEYLMAEGISRGRIAKYLYHLKQISVWQNKPFKKITKSDIINLVRKIENNGYTENTKHDYKVVIKRFYKWLNGSDECPKNVAWIKTTVKWYNTKLPEELITEEDVKKLIDAAQHPRDKAMIAFLYESGCRVGELLNLQIKHIEFDEFGANVTLNGKTGMRKINVISSVPYISVWINYHPFKEKKEYPLWVDISNHKRFNPILYAHFKLRLKEIAKKAGVNKRVNPHSFRHSRASLMANHLTEAQMNNYFGWKQGSNMPSVYVHLSGRDMKNAILKMNGIKIKNNEKKQSFSPKQCHRCEKMNPPGSRFCFRCGTPIDQVTIMKVEKTMKNSNNMLTTLLKDPEVHAFIENKIEQLGLKE